MFLMTSYANHQLSSISGPVMALDNTSEFCQVTLEYASSCTFTTTNQANSCPWLLHDGYRPASMSSCIVTRQLVHNGGYILKTVLTFE